MWTDYVTGCRFSSTGETGKWVFDVSVAEAARLWPLLAAAVEAGSIPAAKRSAPELEWRIGHAILIAYTAGRDPATLAASLAELRRNGLDGPARFKCDRSTTMGREEPSYLSTDFEAPYARPAAGPAPGSTVALVGGGSVRVASLVPGPAAVVVRLSPDGLPENLARLPLSALGRVGRVEARRRWA